MVEDHLVLKPSAGDVWKLTGLVCVNCVFCVVGFYVDVMVLRKSWFWYVRVNRLFGGLYALVLTFHVSLLYFFGLWKMFVFILDID